MAFVLDANWTSLARNVEVWGKNVCEDAVEACKHTTYLTVHITRQIEACSENVLGWDSEMMPRISHFLQVNFILLSENPERPGSVFIDRVRQISRFLMYVRRKMDVFSKYESIEVHGKRFTSMVRRL